MSKSKIEWTVETWNPIVGCSVISPGCKHCYAMSQAARIIRMAKGKPTHYDGTVRLSKSRQQRFEGGRYDDKPGIPVWTGKLAKAPQDTLLEPLRRKKPTTWFVNSMSDLFHENVPDEWIDEIFAVMALCPQHTFQVLTKRSKRMREYIQAEDTPLRIERVLDKTHPVGTKLRDEADFCAWGLDNVWLGVSCEDQQRADERIPDLLNTWAKVRFISAEPLLGPINLYQIAPVYDRDGDLSSYIRAIPDPDDPVSKRYLDWVIVGGESGPHAREMKLDWARSIVEQCAAAGVKGFVKQLGSGTGFNLHDRKGGDPDEWPADLRVREMPA